MRPTLCTLRLARSPRRHGNRRPASRGRVKAFVDKMRARAGTSCRVLSPKRPSSPGTRDGTDRARATAGVTVEESRFGGHVLRSACMPTESVTPNAGIKRSEGPYRGWGNAAVARRGVGVDVEPIVSLSVITAGETVRWRGVCDSCYDHGPQRRAHAELPPVVSPTFRVALPRCTIVLKRLSVGSGPPLETRHLIGQPANSGVRYKEVGHMVGDALAILAVMALLLLFLHEVGSPYHL